MEGHDSPISIHGGGTLAKAIVSQSEDHWSVPDGAILSSWTRRVVAFVVDVIIVYSMLSLATNGMVQNFLNLSLWISKDFHYAAAYALVLLTSLWFYWRVTGLAFSRSLGQKMFGIAIVGQDGSEVTSKIWDSRSAGKLVYLIPIIGWYIALYEIARISQRHTHQSNLDLRNDTIVAHADSLPPASRRHVR